MSISINALASGPVLMPRKIQRRPGHKTAVTPVPGSGADTAFAPRTDPPLGNALAQAFRQQRLQDEGRYASTSDMAAAEKIERGCLGSLLRLTLLVPDFAEAIRDRQQPQGMTLPGRMKPPPWDGQVSRKRSALTEPQPPATTPGPPLCHRVLMASRRLSPATIDPAPQ